MTTSRRYERTPAADTQGLAWLISRFAKETDGVVHAVLLAVDGLQLAASDGCDVDQADKTAAAAGSLIAIANAMSREYDAGMPEILTFRAPLMHFLFMSVSDRAGLAVVAERNCNLGVVGHKMQQLVGAVGERLNPAARSASGFHTAARAR